MIRKAPVEDALSVFLNDMSQERSPDICDKGISVNTSGFVASDSSTFLVLGNEKQSSENFNLCLTTPLDYRLDWSHEMQKYVHEILRSFPGQDIFETFFVDNEPLEKEERENREGRNDCWHSPHEV